MEKPCPLRLARLTKGLTQIELSLRSGVDRNRISFLERGYCVPRPQEKIKLAVVLNAAPDKIFPAEEPPQGYNSEV